MHASNMALVYNPETKHVTPQFHIIFDDDFSSIMVEDTSLTEGAMTHLLQGPQWAYGDIFAPPSEHHIFEAPQRLLSPTSRDIPSHLPGQPQDIPMAQPQAFTATVASYGPKPIYLPIRPTAAFAAWKHPLWLPREPQWHPHHLYFPEMNRFRVQGASDLLGCQAYMPDNDTLTQSAMLKASNREDFLCAQAPELTGLHDSGIFSYHTIDTLPSKACLLNAIWSYCCKRTLAGVLCKYKARLCTDGSQQQYGIDDWETYAPVVSWSMVWLLLTLSSKHKWHSTQIDFTQAFMQPPVVEDIYMKIPQGWYVEAGFLKRHKDPKHRDTSHCFKLEKSLFGIK